MSHSHDAPAHTHAAAHSHGAHADRPGHGPAPEHDDALTELLDLDAALGRPVLTTALDAAAGALGSAPTSAVDLGAGTGTGTLALAARFPTAQVHSLDATASMLDLIGAAATVAGVAGRVQTHLVDLDGDWPAMLPSSVDLAWAALSLHHVSSPPQVLRQAFGALRPGGVLVVTEMTRATTYTPADLGSGRAGLGERVVGALAAHGYPVTAEWTNDLSGACFAPVERQEVSFTASARTRDGARYLALQLGRQRDRIADDLDPADLAALDAVLVDLAAGTSGLELTSGRAVWIATRPVGAVTSSETAQEQAQEPDQGRPQEHEQIQTSGGAR